MWRRFHLFDDPEIFDFTIYFKGYRKYGVCVQKRSEFALVLYIDPAPTPPPRKKAQNEVVGTSPNSVKHSVDKDGRWRMEVCVNLARFLVNYLVVVALMLFIGWRN